MPIRRKLGIAAVLWGVSLCAASAQQSVAPSENANATRPLAAPRQHARTAQKTKTLTPDEGLSVIAAALDSKVRRFSGPDCSHLVNAIYERAGYPYKYASSDDLYEGVSGFQRVFHPQPGDLIVWHGHVGIMVRPSRHVFFSFMSKGPGIDEYTTDYWISRGVPRFYRYVKNDACASCTGGTSARQTRGSK